MTPAITTALRVCPLGKEKVCSKGGTATSWSGRMRSNVSLSRRVTVVDSAVAPAIRKMGVASRHRHAVYRANVVAIGADQGVLPRLVNQVTTMLVRGLRAARAWFSAQ